MVDPRRTFYQKPWASRSWTANRRSYDIILPHLNIIQSASVYGGRVAAGTILVLLAWLVVPPPQDQPRDWLLVIQEISHYTMSDLF